MASITEKPLWESEIYQLETETPNNGGPPEFAGGQPTAGQRNAQAYQLGNRTKYLKEKLDALKRDLLDSSNDGKGASLVGHNGSNVGSIIDDFEERTGILEAIVDQLPPTVEQAGVAFTLLQEHDNSTSAHPELSAFITAEANRAEDAANAAASAGKVYPNTTVGLAETLNGEYFFVPSPEADEYLILYLHSGTTAVEQKRTASEARITTLENEVAELFYEAPVINLFMIDGTSSKTVETGSTVSEVTLSWTLTGDTPDSQSINQGVGSVPVGTLTKIVTGPFTANRTWILTVSDTSPMGNPAIDTADVSLNFRQKRYWGVSTNTTLSNADILALSNEFSTVRGKTVTYDATGGRYPFYCYPVSFGALTSVTVGGLAFSAYTAVTQSFTNASGHTEDYYVIRFNSIQNGSNIQVVWA